MTSLGYTLVVHIGNSNTLFAFFAENNLVSKWRLETRVGRTADEYGLWILSILEREKIDISYIKGIVIATVVPAVEKVITSMSRRYFNLEPFHVVAGVKTGAHINYGRVGDLTVDRLANIVGLYNRYKKSALVVDFGTTTSIDVLNETGKYVGGVVIPSADLALLSLTQAAPQLPDVRNIKPKKVIGKTIEHSMQSGCYFGTIDMVEGLIKRIWAELSLNEGICLATGGFAKEISEGTSAFHFVDVDLTLKGLKYIYDYNN